MKAYFTSYPIALLCQVAPATVADWQMLALPEPDDDDFVVCPFFIIAGLIQRFGLGWLTIRYAHLLKILSDLCHYMCCSAIVTYGTRDASVYLFID